MASLEPTLNICRKESDENGSGKSSGKGRHKFDQEKYVSEAQKKIDKNK